MPASTDITGLAGIAGALGWMVTALPGLRGLSGQKVAWTVVAVSVVAVVPVAGWSVAVGVRGVTGDLSMTTMVWLGWSRWGRGTREATMEEARLEEGSRYGLETLIGVAALALYPMALGIGRIDPYRLGYGSGWFLSTLLVVALVAWFRRAEVVALAIALAVLAWTGRWNESSNLWDYLLDPLVSFYVLGRWGARGVKWAHRRIAGGLAGVKR